jgi:hypothetical protein
MSSEHASTAPIRAERDPDAELDALVAAELAELKSRSRPAVTPAAAVPAFERIEAVLDRLVQMLRGHPERGALIERLRVATLADTPAAAEASMGAVAAEASAPRDPE